MWDPQVGGGANVRCAGAANKRGGRIRFPGWKGAVVGAGECGYVSSVQRFAIAVLLTVTCAAAATKDTQAPPTAEQLPVLAASLADRLSAKTLVAPDGSEVVLGTLLDASRATACLKTISEGGGWPASWLIVSDATNPYDLVLRIALTADGTIADPETMFLTSRREWDDASFDAAFKEATGTKPPREKRRNVVLQSFTKRLVTDYVYDLPATGPGAKGLLAVLPPGSLIREATAIDLRDGAHHTLAVILVNPRFVPADCSTSAGRKTGHRDEGGITVVLAGENGLEDSLDITDIVTKATGASMIPRFACLPGDTQPGAIDALVDAKFEGREPVRLLDLSGKIAETAIDGLPVTVGIKRDGKTFKLFAK
jgi:hypothetical protein